MKKNKVKIAIILFFTITNLCVAFADTVILKSGQRLDVEIIEETDDYINTELYGASLTFFKDEIENIEKADLSDKQDNKSYDISEQARLKKIPIEKLATLIKNENYESAIKELLHLKESFPDDPRIYRYLGLVYCYLGELQEALVYFNKALTLDSDEPRDFLCLGIIFSRLEEKDKAKDNLLKAIKLFEDNNNLIMAYVVKILLEDLK